MTFFFLESMARRPVYGTGTGTFSLNENGTEKSVPVASLSVVLPVVNCTGNSDLQIERVKLID